MGELLLRRYVFIHLDKAADKLELMLAMLHKLYALVSTGPCKSIESVVAAAAGGGV